MLRIAAAAGAGQRHLLTRSKSLPAASISLPAACRTVATAARAPLRARIAGLAATRPHPLHRRLGGSAAAAAAAATSGGRSPAPSVLRRVAVGAAWLGFGLSTAAAAAAAYLAYWIDGYVTLTPEQHNRLLRKAVTFPDEYWFTEVGTTLVLPWHCPSTGSPRLVP